MGSTRMCWGREVDEDLQEEVAGGGWLGMWGWLGVRARDEVGAPVMVRGWCGRVRRRHDHGFIEIGERERKNNI